MHASFSDITLFQHPITEKQFAQLREWNYIVIPTVEKLLACGDRGKHLSLFFYSERLIPVIK